MMSYVRTPLLGGLGDMLDYPQQSQDCNNLQGRCRDTRIRGTVPTGWTTRSGLCPGVAAVKCVIPPPGTAPVTGATPSGSGGQSNISTGGRPLVSTGGGINVPGGGMQTTAPAPVAPADEGGGGAVAQNVMPFEIKPWMIGVAVGAAALVGIALYMRAKKKEANRRHRNRSRSRNPLVIKWSPWSSFRVGKEGTRAPVTTEKIPGTGERAWAAAYARAEKLSATPGVGVVAIQDVGSPGSPILAVLRPTTVYTEGHAGRLGVGTTDPRAFAKMTTRAIERIFPPSTSVDPEITRFLAEEQERLREEIAGRRKAPRKGMESGTLGKPIEYKKHPRAIKGEKPWEEKEYYYPTGAPSAAGARAMLQEILPPGSTMLPEGLSPGQSWRMRTPKRGGARRSPPAKWAGGKKVVIRGDED